MAKGSKALLCRLMSATRLYDLPGDSCVDWELDAYLAGFALVEEMIAAALEDIRAATWGEKRLRMWEQLLGLLYLPGMPRQERQERVLRRLAMGEGDSTPQGMQRSLGAVGIIAQIQEDIPKRRLTITMTGVGEYQSMSDAMAECMKVLPAHMEIVFVLEGPNWLDVNDLDFTWETWDGQERSWKEYEISLTP